MKFKRTLRKIASVMIKMLGIGALIVGAYYVIINKKAKIKDESDDKNELDKTDNSRGERGGEGIIDDVIYQFDSVKVGNTDNIILRHQEAKKIMEESLKSILSENDSQTLVSKNQDDLDEMESALNFLLDE